MFLRDPFICVLWEFPQIMRMPSLSQRNIMLPTPEIEFIID